jgi:spore maturation protein CgeB
MKILFAAPITFDRITFFTSQYFIGLAKAAQTLGHEVRVIQTTENMLNPFVWKFLEQDFATLRKYFKPIVDAPHDMMLMHQLYDEVTRFSPDLLLMCLGDTCYLPFLIRKIRKQNVRVFVWLGLHPSKVSSGMHRLLRSADDTLIYDPAYVDYYEQTLHIHNTHIIPLGCDVSYYESVIPDEAFKQANSVDVSFVGIFDKYRELYLSALSEFSLGIWSWNILDYATPLQKFHRGTVFGENMIKVLKSSKIAVNIHRNFEISGGNYRLYEIPACRVLQLVDEKSDISKYFNIGKEIVTFKNEGDLKEKVRYYLAHADEREKIARAGYERVKKEHTLVQRMAMILQLVKGCG